MNRFTQKLLSSKKPISRWFNILGLCLVSISSMLAYGVIEFDLCNKHNCTELKITGIWHKFSLAFILFGFLALGMAYFLKKEKNLAAIYSDCIVLAFLTVMVLILFIPFSMSLEIRQSLGN